MSELRLISVGINNNYQEPGDRLVLTATWQNIGEKTPDFNAQILVNVEFCGRHRFDQSNGDSYSFKWSPFPTTDMWKKGDIWTTAGLWTLPQMWGGSYKISISLIGENDETISFLGSENKQVFSQYITEIDVGWGWGRKRLLEQRKSIEVKICEPQKVIDSSIPTTLEFNRYIFNKKYPSICGFSDEVWYDLPPEVTVRCIKDNKTVVYRANKDVNYKLDLLYDNRCEYIAETEFCSFTVAFSFCDNILSAEILNVSEKDGYEFIDIKIPSLVQCFDQNGSLVNYYGGGRLVSLKSAVPQTAMFPYDTCSALGICGNNSFAVVTDDMEVVLRQSVVKHGDEVNVGVIGATFVNRIKADKAEMESIPVKMSVVEIHCEEGENWQLSAEILRNKLPNPCLYRYDDTLFYKIRLDASGEIDTNRPETHSQIFTLEDAKNIIMNIYKLSGGMRQVVYLVGWQKGGHDFEYPYPHKSGFNPKCGTREEFIKLCDELKHFNVDLSFHDNFDDAYLSDTYEINKDILSIDEKGKPWKGWLWAGGMSYIISPYAYLKTNEITERVKAVSNEYGIRGTYHLDVMSSEVRRYSFRQSELSAAKENVEAKRGIIDLFNKEDIDITSEMLSFPFIGKIGYAYSSRYDFNSQLFIGETVIPLTTLAFHGVTPYRMSSGSQKSSLLKVIAAGASCSIEAEKLCDDKEIEIKQLRNIYITSMPMTKLSYKKVLSANIDDKKWTVKYEDNGLVEVDFDKETYTIKDECKTVSKDFVTFMPTGKDTYCYYSVCGGNDRIDLPKDWEMVAISSLKDDTTRTIHTDNGEMNFDFKADTPYVLKKA